MRASLIGAVLIAAGCASVVQPVAGKHDEAAAVGVASPAEVGLAFSEYLYAGAFARATSYVLPSDRGLLTILFTGLGAGSVRAEHLAIGSVVTHGELATLVLTGTICSSGAAPRTTSPAPRANEQCLENHDATTDNPAFRISTCKRESRWYVCFPRPDRSQPGEAVIPADMQSAENGDVRSPRAD